MATLKKKRVDYAPLEAWPWDVTEAPAGPKVSVYKCSFGSEAIRLTESVTVD